jgi:hypothetical protein
MIGHSDGKTLVRYRSRSSVSWAKSKIILPWGFWVASRYASHKLALTSESTCLREVCKLIAIANFFKATKYFALRYGSVVRGLVKNVLGNKNYTEVSVVTDVSKKVTHVS